MKKNCFLLICFFFFIKNVVSQVIPESYPANGVIVAGGNGQGSGANQLDVPSDVFVDDEGNLYVADRFNHRIQKWAPGALAGITLAGGKGPGIAADHLDNPESVFVDIQGNIFIADRNNHRVQKWVPDASAGITVAGGNGRGSGVHQLSEPSGVFIDAIGNVYVCDIYNYRVQKWALGATTGTTVAGGNGQGSGAHQLYDPRDIFVDASQTVYVAENLSARVTDQANERIQKWALNASAGTTVAGGNGTGSRANQLSRPQDVYVDATGSVYVADLYNDRIQKWIPGASAGITAAGGNGSGSAANQLRIPVGVFIDRTGNIYVADLGNNRIKKWVPGASAGITVAGGNGSGSANNQLNLPSGVFVDIAGNIYIADFGNHRIQKWSPNASAGITVAGGNGQGSVANQLANPDDIFVDLTGNIYVADLYNHRIQKWAPGATHGVTIAGGNGLGSAANQLNFPSDVFIDYRGDIYVADQHNDRIQKFRIGNVDSFSCPPNFVIAAPSCTEKATISWTAPTDTFLASIETPEVLDPARGIFTFMGAINGHGYYRSTGKHLWSSARDISKSIGANGHLVTINSAEETNLIFNQIKNSGYSPWIGLASTGRQGRFRWVNGEPLTYTNWAPGEPNNFGGSRRNITKPFVSMIDTSGAWNDQPDEYRPFIVEFERPLIRNRQISGPGNGSAQEPGVYTVCYERRDLTTDKRDTCCFTVTVTCDSTLITQATGIVSNNTPPSEKISKDLQVITSPNPSSHTFRLNITSENNEKISLQVTDALGRVVETRNGITHNQPLAIGSGYQPGIYFVRVMQANKTKIIRLIKQAK